MTEGQKNRLKCQKNYIKHGLFILHAMAMVMEVGSGVMGYGVNGATGSQQSSLTLSPLPWACLDWTPARPRHGYHHYTVSSLAGNPGTVDSRGHCNILPSRYRDESGVVTRQAINVGIRWSPPVLQPLLLLLVISAIFCRVCEDCVVDDDILRKSFPTPSRVYII